MKEKKKRLNHDSEFASYVLLSKMQTDPRFSESYRALRTNIHFSFMEKEFHSLVLTSAAGKEGKTLTVANLAHTLSQAGKSVLVIDADLRRPAMTRIFSSKGAVGLTSILSDTFGTQIENGSLDNYGIGDLFRLISFQQKTGQLNLSGNGEELELYFLQGELVHMNWLTRPEEKKLANLLIKNNLLDREGADAALSRQKDTGQKLGYILINLGLVKEDDLKRYLTIHMMEAIRVAAQLKGGTFSFETISVSDFERLSYAPVNLHEIYGQMIVGEEDIPFLKSSINSAIIKPEGENHFLLPSGITPPNPSELLGSERMSFLISHLKRKFDVLLFDTPPVLHASDALLIAPQTDGVAFVVRIGYMNREMIRKAVDQIRMTHANLIGVILNRVDVKKGGYYYKYYRKYYAYSKYYSHYGEKAEEIQN